MTPQELRTLRAMREAQKRAENTSARLPRQEAKKLEAMVDQILSKYPETAPVGGAKAMF